MDMFMGTFQGPYYDCMIGSTSAGFAELVMAGERIEVGLKMGRIQIGNSSGSSGGGNKKLFTAYPRKKDGETNVVHSYRGRGRNHQH